MEVTPGTKMTGESQKTEGLRALARIIARAYLADVQRGVVAGKATEGDKESEDISKPGRNSKNNKRRK
jgi:hypothetical protein